MRVYHKRPRERRIQWFCRLGLMLCMELMSDVLSLSNAAPLGLRSSKSTTCISKLFELLDGTQCEATWPLPRPARLSSTEKGVVVVLALFLLLLLAVVVVLVAGVGATGAIFLTAGAAAVASLLGQSGSSRVRLLLRLCGANFRFSCSSGAVLDLDHSLLAASARAGTVRSGGRQQDLTRCRSERLISSLIWLSSSSNVLVFSSSNSMRMGDSRPEVQPGLSKMSLWRFG